jgi:hypothetical protein
VKALFRHVPLSDWSGCEIIGVDYRRDRFVLREVGKPLCGIWIAQAEQVRIPGREFIPGEAA